jgi:hypothetical protein
VPFVIDVTVAGLSQTVSVDRCDGGYHRYPVGAIKTGDRVDVKTPVDGNLGNVLSAIALTVSRT